MSIFKSIIKDVESATAKIEAEFVKLFNEAPTFLNLVSGAVAYTGPIIAEMVTIAGGAGAGDEAMAVLKDIQSDLAAATQIVKSINGSKSVSNLLANVNSNLALFLSLIKVKDTALVATIESYAAMVIKEISALLGAVPASSTLVRE